MAERRILRALISVSDKTGIVDFARTLKKWSVEIISTGGTANMLADAGIDVVQVSRYADFPEILDGRVKTLHPIIHGGLLALSDNPDHQKTMREHGIRPIDMVVSNLTPFDGEMCKNPVSREKALEGIDIGGHAILRSAAKNHGYVAALSDPADYAMVARKMTELNGALDGATRERLAAKVFKILSRYDRVIAHCLSGQASQALPDELFLELEKTAELSAGQRAAQQAAVYQEQNIAEAVIANARQLSGPALSFDNFVDANTALKLVREFDHPAAVIVKYNTPCGAAVHEDLAEAFGRALGGDPRGAFKGIVAFNRPLERKTAEAMNRGKNSFEIIVAPSVEHDALKILTRNPRWGSTVRVLNLMCGQQVTGGAKETDFHRIQGGFLVQTPAARAEGRECFVTVSRRRPSEGELADLEFAWKVALHLTSNAVVLASGQRVVGVGAAQMKNVEAVHIALKYAGERAKGAVLASGTFFPFNDAVETAIDGGVEAIVHPGGSVNDQRVTTLADARHITLVLAKATR